MGSAIFLSALQMDEVADGGLQHAQGGQWNVSAGDQGFSVHLQAGAARKVESGRCKYLCSMEALSGQRFSEFKIMSRLRLQPGTFTAQNPNSFGVGRQTQGWRWYLVSMPLLASIF
jgi:hypothetical protein